MSTEHEAARSIWLLTGLPEECLETLYLSTDPDDVINSSFKIGSAAQTTIGLAGLSAAHFHELRTGVKQTVKVEARHAVLEFRSEAYYTLDQDVPGPMWDTISGLYKTKDSNFVRVHTYFPHHRQGILNLLNLPDFPQTTKAQVQEALLQWNSHDFEDKAAELGMCAFALRTFAEWDQHPQAQALRNTPPVTIAKIGEAPKRTSSSHTFSHPLENIKVLDLSRVLAGPVAGRTLAAHGADVLLLTSPNLPALPNVDIDTSRGKRTTQLDLNDLKDRKKLQTLVGDADVFLQAYRPGALDGKGFGIQKLLEMKGGREHGIICANLQCAWGWEGPWSHRRGFDSLVQTATGFNVAEAQAYTEYQGTCPSEPKPFPLHVLDHAAGCLLAYGVNAALCKTMTEGGSWEVRVSLAAVGQWLRSLGRISPEAAFGRGNPVPPVVFPPTNEIQNLSTGWTQSNHVDGKKMTAIEHAAILSETPVKNGKDAAAPMVLNSSSATWM